MDRRTWVLVGAVAALGACTGGVGLLTRISQRDIVQYCQNQSDCLGGRSLDVALSECVDEFMDEQQTAKAYDCEDEFEEAFECLVDETDETQCPYDFESFDDWVDENDDDDESAWDECEDELQELAECKNEFVYGSSLGGGGFDHLDTGDFQ